MRLWWLFIYVILAISSAENFSETFTRKGTVVKDKAQGSGVGTALLSTAIDLADNWLALRRLELTVYVDNQRAIDLYKRFGFDIEGETKDFAFRGGEYVGAFYMARLGDEQHPAMEQ